MAPICQAIPIGTTRRQASSPSKKLAMHERQGGICPLCERLMIPGEKLVDEHMRALGLGGSNEQDGRAVVHAECAYAKTYGKDGDLARIAKAKAQKRAALGFTAPKRPIQSAPMLKASPQRRATAPVVKLAGLPRRSFVMATRGSQS